MKTSGGFYLFIIVVFSSLLLTSCADKEIVSECLKGHTYGFFGGIWHGIIAPFDLIGSIFWSDVTVFAQNNNGIWYSLGFLIGSGGWGFLGGRGIAGKR